MKRKEFYNEVSEHIESLKKEEIIDFVNNIIRKIPENKFKEILCIMEGNNISEIDIKKKINKYKGKLKEIQEGSLYFYAEQYEDYSYVWDNWSVNYFDKDNLGDLISEIIEYAIDLVNYKKYAYAKELLDMIMETQYQAFDEDMGEFFELSLSDIDENSLLSFSLRTICEYVIYATYQISKDKVKDIYSYYKNNYVFARVSIEDCFKIGTEQLKNLNTFYSEWIDFLSKTPGIIEDKLLSEALAYTDYIEYEKYLDEITKNHPEIYIEIFSHLQNKNRISELIELGNKVLENINSNSEIGSDIAIYLANIDAKNKEKYVCKAFSFNTSVLNLLRIINNGYYEKNKNDINSKIECIDFEVGYLKEARENYWLLQFFNGNFEGFYNESIKHNDLLGWTNSFIKKAVYLWLLILNENSEKTITYLKIISQFFSDIGYSEKQNELLGKDISKIWESWKSNFKIEVKLKLKVIEWLKDIIEKRVDAILGGNYRKSYHKAALLIVGFNEMMLSQNIGIEGEYIRYYKSKYPRRSAFKSEIDKLL